MLRRGRATASVGATFGLAVLFVAVSFLVALALRAPRPPELTDASATGSAGETAAGANVSPSPSTVSSPTSAGPGSSAPLGVSLDPSGFGLRGRLGCRVPPALETTSDSGRSWHVTSLPGAHLLRVAATGATTAWVIVADVTCAPVAFSTVDAGHTWTGPAPVRGTWVAVGDKVLTPAGTNAAPCLASEHLGGLGVAGTAQAVVICGSRLLRTGDGGASWSLEPVPAGTPTGVTFDATGRGMLALIGNTGCAGVAVSASSDAGRTWASPTCLPAVVQPPIGIAFAAPGSALLTAVASSYRSSDGGSSWHPA